MGDAAVHSAGADGFEGTDRFQVIRRLGQGAMGVVYLAQDHEHNRRVALKTLRRLDPQSLYRFKLEFRAMQGFEHPNLVRLYELHGEGGRWFFTMEYIDGVDLLDFVRPPRPAIDPIEHASPTTDTVRLPPRRDCGDVKARRARPTPLLLDVPGARRAASLFDEPKLRASLSQLARGIAAIHDAEKIHRDVKPTNVLLSSDGRAVLLDFGIAVATSATGDDLDSHDHPTVDWAGTAAYMAPEQASSSAVTTAADWYAFGAVIYEAITGKLPDLGNQHEMLMQKQRFAPPAPRALVPDVPEDLNDLCVELLQFEPRARPSRREILNRLGVGDVDTASTTTALPSRLTQAQPFVGRDAELQQLDDAFAASARATVAVLVHGASGVGKTELVRRFTDRVRAENPGTAVLVGRCYEREQVPYKALDGVADALSRFMRRLPEADASALLPLRAHLLPQLFPVLGRVEAIAAAPREPSPAIDPQEQRLRRFGAFRELFQRLAQRYRVVVVIDDFQWADADSLGLLQELTRGSDTLPALLVATMRTHVDAEGVAQRVASQVADVRRLVLDRLPSASALELVGLLAPGLQAEWPAGVEHIVSEAGGHPLFIQELVRYARDVEGSIAGGLRLDDALSFRIQRLTADSEALLEVLGVAGAPVSQEVAKRASELHQTAFDKAVALLRVAQLARTAGGRRADRIEVYHDRIGTAVVSGLTADRKQVLHARLAAALERTGAGDSDPHALVRHLEASDQAAAAARYAKHSATRAAKALAFDQAAELYRTALRLGGYGDDEARAVRRQLGEALINAGRGVDAAREILAAAEGADPATRLDYRRLAAEQLLISGHIKEGLGAIRSLLADMKVHFPESPAGALASVVWHRIVLALRGLRWKERHTKEIAESALLRVDVYKGLAHGLGLVDPLRGMDFQVRGLLLALRTGEKFRIARGLFYETCFRASQGGRSLPRARRLLAEGAAITEGSDDPYMLGWNQAAHGFVRYFESKFRRSAEYLAEAENQLLSHTSGEFWELATVRQFRIQALRYLGAFADMEGILEITLRDALHRGDRYTETTVRRACNIMWLVGDDLPGARRALDDEWAPIAHGFHLQHFHELRALVEIALYEGRAIEALRELEPRFRLFFKSLLTRVQIVRSLGYEAYGRLALAAAAAGQRDAIAIARRCAKKLARERIGYATVWRHAIVAGLAELEAGPETAQRELEQLIEFAELNAMMPFAASARYRLAKLLGGDAGAEQRALGQTWMQAERVKQPERLVAIFAPGWE